MPRHANPSAVAITAASSCTAPPSVAPRLDGSRAKLVKGSSDYFGINQYTTYYISNEQTTQQGPPSYSSDWGVQYKFERNGVQIGQLAHSVWLYIVPSGMYGVVNYIKEKYQNPTIIISENGMDQPGNLTREEYLHDTVRIDFYKNYLTELKKGIDDGANVVGYFAWSLLDNFEWLSGYTSKFGIVYVDFTTLKRYPKDSAYWFKDMLSGTGSKAATPQTGSGTRPAGSPSATSNGAVLLVSLFVSLCVLVFMVTSV